MQFVIELIYFTFLEVFLTNVESKDLIDDLTNFEHLILKFYFFNLIKYSEHTSFKPLQFFQLPFLAQ